MKYATPSFFPRWQRRNARLLLLLALGVLLAACATGGAGDPAKVVEQYIQAKVAADETAMRGVICSAMEADLAVEASSFAELETRLENAACAFDSSASTVTCSGSIVVTYGTEDSEFPLSTYRVVQEDGAWKWCGETE